MPLPFFQKDLPVFEKLRKGDFSLARSLLKQGEADYIENKLGVSLSNLAPFLGLSEESDTIPVIKRGENVPTFITPYEFESHFGVVYRAKPRFASYRILEATMKKTARHLKYPPINALNDWTKALIEQQMQKSSIKGAIKYIGRELGYGVFAIEDIPQYTYLGQYAGVVRRRQASKDQFNNYIFGYTATDSSTRYVIDAHAIGNTTRFINHSHTPNIISRWITVNGITQIVFIAKRRITRGEQFTYDYGPDYWRTRRAPKEL